MIERTVRTSIHGSKLPPDHDNNWFYEEKDGLEKVNKRILVYEKYHIHVGVYEPKSLPTVMEALGAYMKQVGPAHDGCTKLWRDVDAAYQREKETSQ